MHIKINLFLFEFLFGKHPTLLYNIYVIRTTNNDEYDTRHKIPTPTTFQ